MPPKSESSETKSVPSVVTSSEMKVILEMIHSPEVLLETLQCKFVTTLLEKILETRGSSVPYDNKPLREALCAFFKRADASSEATDPLGNFQLILGDSRTLTKDETEIVYEAIIKSISTIPKKNKRKVFISWLTQFVYLMPTPTLPLPEPS